MKKIVLLLILALSSISLGANTTDNWNEYVWMEGNGEFYINFNNDYCNLEFSFDKTTWTEAVPTSAQDFSSFTKVPANKKIYFRGVNGVYQSFWGKDWWGCLRTTTENVYSKHYTDGSYMNPCFGSDDDNGVRITVGGNVLSLVFGDEFVENSASTVFSTLSRIFTSNSLIEDASELYILPLFYGENQGKLSNYGEQYGTFQWCKGLKNGPHIRFLSKDLFTDCESLAYFYYEGDGTESDIEWFSSKTSSAAETLTIHTRKGVTITNKPSNAVIVEDIPDEEKCAAPTISYQNGKLTFNCATECATFHYLITDTDIKKGSGNEVQLTATYNISVFAAKAGYENSETVTATLCWIDKEPKGEGIINEVHQIAAHAIIVQSNEGVLSVQGADEGEKISVYNLSGQKVGSAKAGAGITNIITSLHDEVAVIKIGKISLKVLVK